jgi:hypothetical protein
MWFFNINQTFDNFGNEVIYQLQYLYLMILQTFVLI